MFAFPKGQCKNGVMNLVDPSFVERYQLLLQRDPKSKGFAALAEAYRKMGMLPEAESTCLKGLRVHPNFASGRVALAKVYIDMREYDKALRELDLATQVSPENLLANSLKGDVLLELRQPKLALKAYKLALLFNPADAKAAAAVQSLESLTADEYDEELFAFKPLRPGLSEVSRESDPADPNASSLTTRRQRDLQRIISLADALIVRNDIEKAIEALHQGRRLWGEDAELERRLKLLDADEPKEAILVPRTQEGSPRERQILRLTRLLKQIETRKFLS